MPLLDKASKNKNIIVGFMDAVHLLEEACVGKVWSIERLIVKSGSGRKRFNVLGFLESKTNAVIEVSNSTYITSTQIVEMLEKLRLKYGKGKEINIILDNARYQKCKLVIEKATELKINLVYLPPYSPNLNLIERLWKFLRKKCLVNKYHMNFKEFSETILDCLSKTTTEHSKALESWLSHKFEIFN